MRAPASTKPHNEPQVEREALRARIHADSEIVGRLVAKSAAAASFHQDWGTPDDGLPHPKTPFRRG